MRK
ncbi:inositol monophosphatase family protein, partial [Chlamydia psittaci 06-1683]|jgi:ABC-type branched-subunit amino acid transport system substrate-binding protein